MADFTSEANHRYDMNEASGNLIDRIGLKDSTTQVGPVLTYTGNRIITNGVDNAILWLLANNPIDITGDWTLWLTYEMLGLFDEISAPILASRPAALAPFITYGDSSPGSEHQLRFNADSNDSSPTMDLGRFPTNNETQTIVWSYQKSTKLSRRVCITTGGIDVNAEDTDNPNNPVAGGLTLGNDGSAGFYSFAFAQFGVVNGAFKSIADMQDTANARNTALKLVDGTGFIVDPVVDPIKPKVVPRIGAS